MPLDCFDAANFPAHIAQRTPHNLNQGEQVKPTEHIAATRTASRTGFRATLGSLLGAKGTGAPFATSCKGTGAPSSVRRLPFAGVLLILFSIAALAAATPALAEGECSTCKPWWHLESGSRPTYLAPGKFRPGRNEVQKVLVEATAGEFALANMTKKEVEEGDKFTNAKGENRYANFPLTATAAEVQTGLETGGLYGAGNVAVTGGCEQPVPAKFRCTFEVTFKGALAERPVPLLNTELGTAFFELAGTETATELVQGQPLIPDGEVVFSAVNVGDANANGGSSPVVMRDVLPPGLRAKGVTSTEPEKGGEIHKRVLLPCSIESERVVTCTDTGHLAPYDLLEMRVAVEVQNAAKECSPGEATCEQNVVSISGGGAQEASLKRPVTVNSAPTPFGVEDYELSNEAEGGAVDTHAGSHPFQQTTTIVLNQSADTAPVGQSEIEANPVALAKDLHIKWPPGLIGNPTSVPRCTIAQFLHQTSASAEENECPANSAVGVAVVTVREPGQLATTLRIPVPLFNLEPAVGEPARFGFFVIAGDSPVVIDTAIRTGSDYGITVSSDNITQTAGFLAAQVTVWGNPLDSSHDSARSWACLYDARGVQSEHAPCVAAQTQHAPPFLSLPTSCAAATESSIEGDSWLQPGSFSRLASFTEPKLDGCNQLPFGPQIRVSPDGQQASRPTGLTVDVHVPQEGQLNPTGDAESNIRSIRVVLPEGMILNPAAADGLQSCTEAQVGYLAGESTPPGELHFSEKLPEPLEQGLNFCPDAAKVGTAKIVTPLLPVGQALEGAVYLATPAPNEEDGNNPFRSTVAMYILAKDPVSGALVKLPGRVTLNQETGRIESTFENTPQLAFEDAEIHFFGGERAPLATPSLCRRPGEEGYKTVAEFTPWSGTPPVKSTSEFFITSGPGGGPCPNPPGSQSPTSLPFSAQLQAGSPNINAGSFSPLDTTISREDGNQNINQVTLHMAPGMSGILAGVPLCPEAQANAGTCSEASRIGETIVSVGLGGDPYTVTGGKVYLTEKYAGGAFGLSIVNPADAGPFHLGKVIVRASIQIDPLTAALTITTGTIPHIIKGFPLQIKHVNVTINRPGFTFNPTNCSPMSITGTIGAVEGATSPVSDPFQVTNCATLKFTPKVTVTTAAKTSKANGASLLFKIAYPKGAQGSQSWFNEAKFDLPKQLPARLTTIQKACLASVFESNPAACPPASLIGHAVVHTQVLPVPLVGPVYFVSHGGAKFPDAVLVLQGYGVTVDLVGETFINGKTGITSATFRNTPDVPFESIEVTIPSGPHGEFGANLPAKAKGSFCGQKLVMPTLFKAQNGLEIHQNTSVGVTGCGKAKTRAQLLAAALKACHKDKNKAKRKRCEATAHRKYGPIKKKKK